ncbi:pts system, N-acetylglucosamine-specific IIABC component [Salmonella enterica subsp. salamae]|uniref:Pts system, N-acetylglucosamine-specific IIABC component n=1 Tax=Salmonella enterica subsp. salamae TaxID=59202 RepID=A0A6D2GC48_SALER|nr:pts system, N-acetylglucosamine-specific IIABC component [Salmonella enterica subsp. salamae]
MQLPIAVLPVAALLLRFGQPDLLNMPFIAQAGGSIFDNLALVFAIGVASSWSKDSAGAAALAGAVGYFVMTKAMVTINPEINMGVLAGIITVWSAARFIIAGLVSNCPIFSVSSAENVLCRSQRAFSVWCWPLFSVTSGRRYSMASMRAVNGSFPQAHWVPVSLASSTVC